MGFWMTEGVPAKLVLLSSMYHKTQSRCDTFENGKCSKLKEQRLKYMDFLFTGARNAVFPTFSMMQPTV